MDKNISNYVVLPAFVRFNNDLSAGSRLLYGELVALSSLKGYCFASNGYLAGMYSVAERTISKWIEELEDAKLIKRKLIYKNGTKEVAERQIYVLEADTYNKINNDFIKVKEEN